ncbi:MAG: NmrA family NAD(P)-binding protein [Inquilinus limosus]|uniref:NmrA family NAD(P)-binding protein n=1 Tax=Inquilinus limosus TaxID=171674 RepID=A0A952FMT3_9PROT|nr:NmrA family NAD(P)-binding protein [Inquilinus limosus]
MYVVTGVTGRTGAATAQALIEAGERVRVVVRDAAKGESWARKGAEVAVADLADVPALSDALSGANGAYLLVPPYYAEAAPIARGQALAGAIAEAVTVARLPKLAALSSIGADLPEGTGLILVNRAIEQHLAATGTAATFLRAAYFMENWAGVAGVAAAQGVLPSFLAPLDRAIPMVATADIGHAAAEALREDWTGIRTIGLEGPAGYSPNDVAAAFARALGRPVQAVAVPEADWPAALSQAGLSPDAVDGFVELNRAVNSGHVDFAADPAAGHRRGRTPIDTVVAALVKTVA